MMNRTIIQWEGPGWYAGRQDADGNQTWFCFGHDSEAQPDTWADGYGNPEWWDEKPTT